jgi:drug/metabolite transporter (DMT)-like permease
MPVTTTAWATSILFGMILGWTLGRTGPDRRNVLAAALITAAVGGIVWATGPAAGSEPAMAGVSMTLGGAATAVSIRLAGHRPAP